MWTLLVRVAVCVNKLALWFAWAASTVIFDDAFYTIVTSKAKEVIINREKNTVHSLAYSSSKKNQENYSTRTSIRAPWIYYVAKDLSDRHFCINIVTIYERYQYYDTRIYQRAKERGKNQKMYFFIFSDL